MRTHIQRWVFIVLAVGLGASVLPALPEMSDFARYQIILDRKPFGEVVAAALPPGPPPGPAPDSFIKSLRMVAIKDDEDGTRVGFVDLRSNPPKSYYLYIGQSADGIEVLDADYVKESALLKSGTDEQWISMKADPSAAPPGAAVQTGTGAPEAKTSYTARRRRRLDAAVQPTPPPAPALTPDQVLEAKAVEQHLQQQQMDAIRQGLPPLPIPLTPEMDAQLVAEGVLPAIDETAPPAPGAPAQ